MVRLPVISRIKAQDVAWAIAALAVVAIEHFHPILPHQWMLMCVSLTSYVASLPGSNKEHSRSLRGWLWAKRYPCGIFGIFLLCALVDMTLVDNDYAVLGLIGIAFVVSLAVMRRAKKTT